MVFRVAAAACGGCGARRRAFVPLRRARLPRVASLAAVGGGGPGAASWRGSGRI